MTLIQRAALLVMVLGGIGFGVAIIAESAVKAQMHLAQIAQLDETGDLKFEGVPFSAIVPVAKRLPGLGDKNSYLIRPESRNSVLTEPQVKSLASLAQMGTLLVMLVGGLVLAVTRSRLTLGAPPPP
jgi:hypothetical protein